jgi:hypothetical protein
MTHNDRSVAQRLARLMLNALLHRCLFATLLQPKALDVGALDELVMAGLLGAGIGAAGPYRRDAVGMTVGICFCLGSACLLLTLAPPHRGLSAASPILAGAASVAVAIALQARDLWQALPAAFTIVASALVGAAAGLERLRLSGILGIVAIAGLVGLDRLRGPHRDSADGSEGCDPEV